MSSSPKNFLDLKSISSEQIADFFSKTKKLKSNPLPALSQRERIALLFFEPSTRTRMSFESAAYRCGLGPLVFDGGANTSLEKGETVEDSILNIAAMEPKLLVIRCDETVDLHKLSIQLPMPIVNAGWGSLGHPTQALLDAFTMLEHFSSLRGIRVLILGDILHSRVAASHFELLPKLGAEIGICGPAHFLTKTNGVQTFVDLEQGLVWADVAMALRVQFERHVDTTRMAGQEYRKKYGLSKDSLQSFKSGGIIMHPGPVNHGIEMEAEVFSDSRCRLLQQVCNGVYIRETLIRELYR